MHDRSIDLGSDRFYFMFLSIELNDKAMMSTNFGDNRRKVGPATRSIVVPMSTEGDRYRAARRPFIRTGFEPNSVLATMREGTFTHLEEFYTLNR